MNKSGNLGLRCSAGVGNAPPVQNSGLGRGLGKLMEPRPSVAPGNDAAKTEPATEVRGVRLYLHTTAKSETAPASAAEPPARPRRVVSPAVLVSLFVADALLCVLAWWMVRSSHGALGWFGWLLAGTAIVFGAWLSLLAVQTVRRVNDGD